MSTAPVRQRRKDARPQELLDAALALFVEKGFAATRSEEIAARAGVAKGTLYRYYPSKDELFKAMVRENLSEGAAGGVWASEHGGGPLSAVEMVNEAAPFYFPWSDGGARATAFTLDMMHALQFVKTK